MSRRHRVSEDEFELDDIDEEDLDDEDRESERDLGDDDDDDDDDTEQDDEDDVPPISAIVDAVASAHLVTPRELWTKAKAGTLPSVRNARNVAMAAVAAAGAAKGNGHLFGVSDSALWKAKQHALATGLATLEQLEKFAKGFSLPGFEPSPDEAKRQPKPKASLVDLLPAPAPSLGRKLDAGKARLDLLPFAAVTSVGEVLGYGAEKYGAGNWKHVENARDRYLAASLRHIFAFAAGDVADTESGLPHLSHAVASLLFLIEGLR